MVYRLKRKPGPFDRHEIPSANFHLASRKGGGGGRGKVLKPGLSRLKSPKKGGRKFRVLHPPCDPSAKKREKKREIRWKRSNRTCVSRGSVCGF